MDPTGEEPTTPRERETESAQSPSTAPAPSERPRTVPDPGPTYSERPGTAQDPGPAPSERPSTAPAPGPTYSESSSIAPDPGPTYSESSSTDPDPGPAPSERPSAPTKPLFAGIDIGGTKLYVVIVDEDGTILARARRKSRAEKGFLGVMARVEKTLTEACEAAGTTPQALEAIGVGAPSPILPDGTAVNAPNMGWHHVPLADILEQHLQRPVFAGNDCNLGTLGEYTLGAGQDSQSLIGLFVGTGLGGGFVHRGEVIEGENHMAAEFGHMIMVPNGRRCGCGHLGCLEAYASKSGMGRRFVHEISCNGRRSLLTEFVGDSLQNAKSSRLAKAYAAQDPLTVEILHEAADFLGYGIGNLITLLGPDTIVLGGGVFEALGKQLLPRVKAAAKSVTHPADSFAGTRILETALGDDAVALGAFVLARDALKRQD